MNTNINFEEFQLLNLHSIHKNGNFHIIIQFIYSFAIWLQNIIQANYDDLHKKTWFPIWHWNPKTDLKKLLSNLWIESLNDYLIYSNR